MTERTAWNRRTTPLPEPHLRRLQLKMARGHSLEEAAQAVGLTLPLAKSVFIRSGLPVPKPLRHRVVSDLGKRIHEHLREVDTGTMSEVAAALGVNPGAVRKAVWDVDRHRLVPRATASTRYSDTAILIGLQLMAYERGRLSYALGPAPVSAEWWDAHRDPAAHPPATEVRRRFGTWLEACRAAGIPTRNHTKPPGSTRRWTDAELEESLREFFAAQVGTTTGAFTAWSRPRPEAPSLQTVLTRFGRWSQIQERFSS